MQQTTNIYDVYTNETAVTELTVHNPINQKSPTFACVSI